MSCKKSIELKSTYISTVYLNMNSSIFPKIRIQIFVKFITSSQSRPASLHSCIYARVQARFRFKPRNQKLLFFSSYVELNLSLNKTTQTKLPSSNSKSNAGVKDFDTEEEVSYYYGNLNRDHVKEILNDTFLVRESTKEFDQKVYNNTETQNKNWSYLNH